MSEAKRILITGARSPVAVDWAQCLMNQGHQVTMTDCSRFPLGRFIKGIEGYLRTPPPKQYFDGYCTAVLDIIDSRQIDIVIPTCEEIFYLAKLKAERPDTHWFMPDFNLLHTLHNKKQVFDALTGLLQIRLPKTELITSKKQLQQDSDWILKPVYSRFGTEVIRNITTEAIAGIDVSAHTPWVRQQKLNGRPICLSALFCDGKLIAHQSYLPRYCVNGSAATWFEPVSDCRIQPFLEAFGTKHRFHGQVSFDFVEDDNELYVIECNPRATSGLHLLTDQLIWKNNGLEQVTTKQPEAKHLGSAMLMSGGLRSFFSKQSWQSYLSATCAIDCTRYPVSSFGIILSSFELLFNAVRKKRSLSSVTTFDIEWNGEQICR